MDEYGAASQQKATAALEAGLFKDEIAPITVTMPAWPTRSWA
jgi:acetyl-CoA C-acetyltransferase